MTPEYSRRQLSAIMFADMVGYTAMMQENELLGKTKRDKFRKTIEQYVEEHGGKVLQYYGDGALCTFDSAIQAASGAVQAQLKLLEEPRVRVRMGLHSGDVVFDKEGIYGDGVNVSSRIESLSVPGSIMISDRLYDDIKNQSQFRTRSMGEFQLKNVKRSIEVFALANEGLVVPNKGDLKGKLREKIKSIAVMPFVNMSSDPDNEYFSDGVTEELISALSKVDGIQVISRSSSFSLKGSNEDVREIGKKLNVTTVLEGSVRKAGSKVRINAQLVNASDGYHMWSNSYDRHLEDIFDLQDEISRKIANSLREKLAYAEKEEPLVARATSNMRAYNDYLLALFYQNKWTLTNVKKAIGLYKKVVKTEPEFSLPYAGLAQCYTFMGSTGHQSPKEAFTEAEIMAAKSMELDERTIEAYLAQASAQFFYYWDWEKAVSLLDKALEISPNDPEAHLFYSLYHIIQGHYKEALATLDKALQIDPLSMHILRTKADVYYFDDQYEKALKLYDTILKQDPNYKSAEEFKGWTLLQMKDYDAALAIFAKMENTTYAIKPEAQLGYAYALAGERDLARKYLSKVEERAATETGISLNYDLATLHTGLGDADKAFHYLDQCIDERLGQMIFFDQSPIWRPLKSDPRFSKIAARIGLNHSG